jgi:hypothetical protein
MILENLSVADVAPQRVHALVPSRVGHLEKRRAVRAIGPTRRFQRLTIWVAIGEERTWLDLPLVPPGRE